MRIHQRFLVIFLIKVCPTNGLTQRKEWTEAVTDCESQGTRLPTFSEAVSMNLGDVWVLDRLYYTTWFYLRSCVNASSLINETGALFVDDPLQCFAFCKSRRQAMNLQMSDANHIVLCSCSARTNQVGFSRSCGRCFDDSYFVCGRNSSFVAQYTWDEEMVNMYSTSRLNWESDMCLAVGCVQTETGLEFNEMDCAEANVPFCAWEEIKDLTVDTNYKPFNETFDICPVGYPVFSTNITCSASSYPAPHWVNAFRLLKTCYSSNDSDCQQFMIENPPTFSCQKIKNEELEIEKCDDDIKFVCIRNVTSFPSKMPSATSWSTMLPTSSSLRLTTDFWSKPLKNNSALLENKSLQSKKSLPVLAIVLGTILPIVAAIFALFLYLWIRRQKKTDQSGSVNIGESFIEYDSVNKEEVQKSHFYTPITVPNDDSGTPNQVYDECSIPNDYSMDQTDGFHYDYVQSSKNK